jgi:hypothetical protein
MPSKPEIGFGPDLGWGEIAIDLPEARFWIVGSEEARLRASLRPPLKLHVRFSRMQLSRRHMT